MYRRSIDIASGTGQLMLMQARAFKAAGVDVTLACDHGGLKFRLRTGWPARRLSVAKIAALQAERDVFVVDHSLAIPSANVVCVHNLMSEVARHMHGVDAAPEIAAEAAFFRELKVDTPVIANSRLVKAALTERFGIAAERISVIYPGFRSDRFGRGQALRLRAAARRALRLAPATPLIGFVTSGDFAKRGLDLFLAAAVELLRARPDARFLVVGSKRLPAWALGHPLVADGLLQHRGKSARPLQWFAALDVFLYPAHFEEFGMVVLEALACGIPVLTSRRVGAAECLPPPYEPWLSELSRAQSVRRAGRAAPRG